MQELTKEARLPPYMAYPRFLLNTDLNETARLIYILLLDRARLSLKNGWVDEQGRVYIYFPITDIAQAAHVSDMTVKRALAALSKAGLIHRVHQGANQANRIYVRVPVQNKNDRWDGTNEGHQTERKCSPSNNKSNNKPTRNYDYEEGESL